MIKRLLSWFVVRASMPFCRMFPAGVIVCLCISLLIPAHTAAAQNPPDAHAILKSIDDLWRGSSSKANVSMRVKTAHWERAMVMNVYSKGTGNSLIKIVKPFKEQGIATLKVGNEIYNYLPKTDRTMKMTAAMMMGAWMGSHFTYDDLVKESRLSEDYIPRISFSGMRDGQEIIELTLLPKPRSVVVWGKIVLVVQDDGIPLSEMYFDEDGKKVRLLSFDDYRRVSGQLVPMRLKMIPQDKPGEFTEITFLSLALNVSFPSGFFSLSELKR